MIGTSVMKELMDLILERMTVNNTSKLFEDMTDMRKTMIPMVRLIKDWVIDYSNKMYVTVKRVFTAT